MNKLIATPSYAELLEVTRAQLLASSLSALIVTRGELAGGMLAWDLVGASDGKLQTYPRRNPTEAVNTLHNNASAGMVVSIETNEGDLVPHNQSLQEDPDLETAVTIMLPRELEGNHSRHNTKLLAVLFSGVKRAADYMERSAEAYHVPTQSAVPFQPPSLKAAPDVHLTL